VGLSKDVSMTLGSFVEPQSFIRVLLFIRSSVPFSELILCMSSLTRDCRGAFKLALASCMSSLAVLISGRSRMSGSHDKALRRQLNTVRLGMRESEEDQKSEGRLDPAVN
jgi:hypothetical protein